MLCKLRNTEDKCLALHYFICSDSSSQTTKQKLRSQRTAVPQKCQQAQGIWEAPLKSHGKPGFSYHCKTSVQPVPPSVENFPQLTQKTFLGEDAEEPSCYIRKKLPAKYCHSTRNCKHTLLVPKVTGQGGWYLWSSDPTCAQGLLH